MKRKFSGRFKRKLRKISSLGLTPRQILEIVIKTNLRLAAKLLKVSDVGLRKYLVRENLYAAARVRKVRRVNRKKTVNAYDVQPSVDATPADVTPAPVAV